MSTMRRKLSWRRGQGFRSAELYNNTLLLHRGALTQWEHGKSNIITKAIVLAIDVVFKIWGAR
jgi:hypothetical protein